ncbi:MAG: response regulator transcription factor [Actinomycetota bacterium]
MNADQVTLLICDDHKLLTDALTMVVERDGQLSMPAGPVSDPEDAVEICRKDAPDVVLMDVAFDGRLAGIEATRRIKEVSPDTKVVIVTGQEDQRLLVEAIEAGASGFLSKSEVVDGVLGAVKDAARGEVLVDPATLARVLRQVAREREEAKDARERLESLTKREREILGLLPDCVRNEEIANRLHISPRTVQTHVANMLAKLSVHSKLEAVTFGVRNGVFED